MKNDCPKTEKKIDLVIYLSLFKFRINEYIVFDTNYNWKDEKQKNEMNHTANVLYKCLKQVLLLTLKTVIFLIKA